MPTNYCKEISATKARIGELRFSYAYVFSPRRNEDGTPGKYSAQLLIPKSNTAAKKMIDAKVEAAINAGIPTKFGGKRPVPAKLHLPLRDGDEEFPDDPNYAGIWFLNATNRDAIPVRVLKDGVASEATDDDFYSGVWGFAFLSFYAYSNSGNLGIAAGLDGVVATRDDKRLGGGKLDIDAGMSDLVSDANSWLD